jgi:hypothetical protein
MLDLSVQEVAKATGIPVETWPENCYAIACALVKAKLVEGKPMYGHWLGPVDPNCRFAGRPIVSHGWVETGREKFGPHEAVYITDPTRYVFEGKEPYIWRGVDFDEFYDLGGNRLRAMLQRPVPTYNAEEHVDLVGSVEDMGFVFNLLGSSAVDKNRLFWLANLPLQALGERAKAVYQMIVDAGLKAAIPLDNYELIMS